MSLLKRIEKAYLQDTKDRHALRQWWHGILSNHGKYACYAIFLALPSDKETIRYLTKFGRELDLLSGENCLVIALGKTEFKRFDLDVEVQDTKREPNFFDKLWNAVMKEQIEEGYSIKIAQLFEIGFNQFPCLLLFQDIRSPNHVVVTFKGMTAEEIAEKIRSLFSAVQKAILEKQNPLEAVESIQSQESFRKTGQTIVGGLRSIAGKTFETAMEAWIRATIK
jgi:hypothetical protein